MNDKIENFKKKTVLSKDFWKTFISIILILMVFIMNGFLSFMQFGGFNLSQLKTVEYWINYALLIASEIIIMVSIYSIKKSKNLQNSEILELSKFINDNRKKIYKINRVKESANWLRNYYNWREKLNLFEDKITSIQTNCNIDEPLAVEKEDKHLYKQYLKKLKQYNKNKEKYDWCIEQLALIKLYRNKLEYAKLICVENAKLKEDDINIEKIKEYETRIDEIDKELQLKKFAYSNFKFKYENVYWDTLIAEEKDLSEKNRPNAYFHENKLLFKKLKSFIASSLIISALLVSMLPPLFNNIGWQTLLNELLKIIVFCLAALKGIITADNNILFHYKSTLDVRKRIYNELNYDLGFTKIIIEENSEEKQ